MRLSNGKSCRRTFLGELRQSALSRMRVMALLIPEFHVKASIAPQSVLFLRVLNSL